MLVLDDLRCSTNQIQNKNYEHFCKNCTIYNCHLVVFVCLSQIVSLCALLITPAGMSECFKIWIENIDIISMFLS